MFKLRIIANGIAVNFLFHMEYLFHQGQFICFNNTRCEIYFNTLLTAMNTFSAILDSEVSKGKRIQTKISLVQTKLNHVISPMKTET